MLLCSPFCTLDNLFFLDIAAAWKSVWSFSPASVCLLWKVNVLPFFQELWCTPVKIETRRGNELNNMAEGGNSRGLRSRSLEVMGVRKNRRERGRHARLGNSRVIAREFPLSLPFRAPPTHALAKKLETFNFFTWYKTNSPWEWSLGKQNPHYPTPTRYSFDSTFFRTKNLPPPKTSLTSLELVD